MAKLKKITTYVFISLLSIILGAVIGCSRSSEDGGALFFSDKLNPPAAKAQTSDARNTPIVRAAQAVSPAVVGITNKAFARDIFNRQVMIEQGAGSGVIFDTNGYIATNYHVVANASEIVVSLADGRTFNGTVLGVDPATDLAVVKVSAPNLPVATLGDSDSLMIGEPAVAIGNPLGLEFKGSVTAGIISGLNRPLEIGEQRLKLIQTDAAISPGNSGGALVNADGVVIGINSAKISFAGVEGIGFAIPINSARPILQSIIENGRVVRSYLGISALDKNTALKYGYDLKIDRGVFVANLFPNGPAAKSGIQQGDIILKINGSDIHDVNELRSTLDKLPVGSKVDILIERNRQNIIASVLLEEMPPQR
ncbi:MAG: trypsin-like peptidase domain-containing protein [Sporomusaceae bacterium]|jgi:serine protease Do|nr:trypsin-like peptidase domain-containing protein [Sporomusaceae bacterium]